MASSQITITCAKCQRALVGPPGKSKPDRRDIVRCPVHGDVGRYEDVAKAAADKIARQIGKEFEKMSKTLRIKLR